MAVEAKTIPLHENPAAPYLARIVVASWLKKHNEARALALNTLNEAGKFYIDASSQSDRLGAINLFISAMWEVFRLDATPDAEHLMMQLSQAFEELRLGSYPKALLPVLGAKKPQKLDLNQWMFRAVLVLGKEVIIEADAEQGVRDCDQSACDKLKAMLRNNGLPLPKLIGNGSSFEGILHDFTAPSRRNAEHRKRNEKRDAAHRYYATLKEGMSLVRLERGYLAREMLRFFEEEILAKDPFIPRKPKQKGGGPE